MSNFKFLQQEWYSLYSKLKKAEERVNTEPVSSASYCRLMLEESMYLIFDFEHIEKPFNTELVNLMNDEGIKSIIPHQLREGLHIVRKTGNNAAHYGNRITPQDALVSIRYSYDFAKWFAQNYSIGLPALPGFFDEQFIPKLGETQRLLKEQQKEQEKAYQQLLEQIAKLQEEKEAILEKAQESEASLEAFKQQTQQAVLKLKKQKQARLKTLTSEYTEAETRLHLIDADLKEAGWFKLIKNRDLEYPVTGMPITADNPKGNGFVDYVLWDDNGKPLAIIEAKRTSKDVEVGKHQAFLYANCIEKMHGQRPVIFYTNGFETKIWEDTFYSSPRRVYGFYAKDELQWLIQKRATIKDLRLANINTDIAGRPYQKEAIQRVAEAFVTDGANGIVGNKRRALLVMATGSGKTRTAAAMVDVLFKNNWVKRVLFLADRNALVRQAKNNFSEYLPDLSSIDLTEEKENDTTRLVFSTYPSMMNRIDNIRNAEERFYGVGHFDLIIVDEAHRSVYNRYKAIFDYFDAAIIGLTATPKDGIDHNTFELFGCSNEDPTFLYELHQAVPVYLKPYKNIDITTKFIREGIKYKELSEADKLKYEETFADKTTGLFPEEIRANAMNKWLFNKDTVFKVLDSLMKDGLKIEGGDKIGRTIIFAVNQKHAKFIVDCFTERYPDKPAGFIAMVHNEVSHAQSLIDAFCDKYKENNPQIAVSVDMMDTGIDAIRILNLVFFKVVRSYAKFWQMIGRGTRLCEDVFGPNQPKEEFLIFDVCGNFEFFELKKERKETRMPKPVTQQIFEDRLHLSRLLAETGEIEDLALSKGLRDILHHAIKNLDKNRFQVGMNLRHVAEFEHRDRWNNIDSNDVHIIEEHLSDLPIPESINEAARRFDLMMLKLQIATLMANSFKVKYQETLVEICNGLSKKYTIPAVLRAKDIIEDIKRVDFFKEVSQMKLDSVREELRELVQYLESQSKEIFYSDLQDEGYISDIKEPDFTSSYGKNYKLRVESFIRENKHQLTISKLNSNQPITVQELKLLEDILFDGDGRGTKEDFEKEFGKEPLGFFIRSIVGLDLKAAQEAFSDFLQKGNLRADQMTFIQKIISHLAQNGTIDPSMLFESPFTDVNDQGLLGVFDDGDAHKVISIIERINENATA
ncbi:type i site-specific deoxyribonuclease [Flavobacterium enshiense DK69]|uniref:Type I site-specific deoxyribonuclease n=1 Tax=Flavobacterium enshiense DK69 TaxID=1107311 RepID=V6SDM4_9FLAO|nr:DEAD/DEAH box helicase family protein [Flavobacterium enshiense]ESU24362.1 type i site-specific deoxyribonuclease [Flavobacterium enshiense DK69]KGO94468.1 type I site-specific deoxyribonuclease [Flavobacterium enshiense DK69]